MDVLYALVSAVVTAAYFVYASQTMKRCPDVSSSVTLAVSHLAGAILLAPVWCLWMAPAHAEILMSAVALPMLAASALLVISRELYFYAYSRTDVANITVFSALTPVYTIGTGYVFLREVPTPAALMGLALICGGIYSLFLIRKTGDSLFAAIMRPFRRIVASTPVFCAFLSTIPTAFAAVLQKQLLVTLDPISFSFGLLSIIGIAAISISVIWLKPKEVLAQCGRLPIHFFVISAIMLPVMHIAFCLVMQHHQAAISLVLQRSSILFQIVLAYIWLRERQDIGKRLLVAAAIMLGFALIMFGG